MSDIVSKIVDDQVNLIAQPGDGVCIITTLKDETVKTYEVRIVEEDTFIKRVFRFLFGDLEKKIVIVKIEDD